MKLFKKGLENVSFQRKIMFVVCLIAVMFVLAGCGESEKASDNGKVDVKDQKIAQLKAAKGVKQKPKALAGQAVNNMQACLASGCSDSTWPGDNWCDPGCNTAECNFDDGDCAALNSSDLCAHGCLDGWPGDNYCDASCNNAACNFDNGDCKATTLCAPGCLNGWPGDNWCDASCNNAACGFDNGDCGSQVKCVDPDGNNLSKLFIPSTISIDSQLFTDVCQVGEKSKLVEYKCVGDFVDDDVYDCANVSGADSCYQGACVQTTSYLCTTETGENGEDGFHAVPRFKNPVTGESFIGNDANELCGPYSELCSKDTGCGCYDPDGTTQWTIPASADAKVKSTTVGMFYGSFQKKTDSCNGNQLSEYTCVGGMEMGVMANPCPSGTSCQDGACI